MGKTKEIIAKSDGNNLVIELVELDNDKSEILHIQTDKWRIELNLQEFGEIAASIYKANKKLSDIKSGQNKNQ